MGRHEHALRPGTAFDADVVRTPVVVERVLPARVIDADVEPVVARGQVEPLEDQLDLRGLDLPSHPYTGRLRREIEHDRLVAAPPQRDADDRVVHRVALRLERY